MILQFFFELISLHSRPIWSNLIKVAADHIRKTNISQIWSASLIKEATDLHCCVQTSLNTKWPFDYSVSCTEHPGHLTHTPVRAVWEWDAAPDPVRTTGAPGSFMEGGGIVKGNDAGRTKRGGVGVYILKQRGCLLSLAADPTCRWSTQSPGRSKSQGPGWTSLWNGNGA